MVLTVGFLILLNETNIKHQSETHVTYCIYGRLVHIIRDKYTTVVSPIYSAPWRVQHLPSVRSHTHIKTPYINEHCGTYERMFSTVLEHMLNTPRRCCYESPDCPGNKRSNVMYVWFDALSNYLTGVHGLDPDHEDSRYWPASRYRPDHTPPVLSCPVWKKWFRLLLLLCVVNLTFVEIHRASISLFIVNVSVFIASNQILSNSCQYFALHVLLFFIFTSITFLLLTSPHTPILTLSLPLSHFHSLTFTHSDILSAKTSYGFTV